MTGQGVRWRKNRAALDCCGDIETQFIDYRFLKDLELRREPKCCCCCVGSELLIYADDKDSVRYVGVVVSCILYTQKIWRGSGLVQAITAHISRMKKVRALPLPPPPPPPPNLNETLLYLTI